MAQLKDWANAAEVGTRFPKSRYDCPRCGQRAQEDNWPPNYGGGSGSFAIGPTGNSRYQWGTSQKCVCVACRVAFRVSESKDIESDGGIERILRHDIVYSETVPLVERDSWLLTPHDVWREDYKAEHGHYPQEGYA